VPPHQSNGSRACSRCWAQFWPARHYHYLCWDCWRETHPPHRPQPPRLSGVVLEPELVKAAVTLAHPDRHPPERRELATRVTAALLGALREAAA
jgi:hypothetical protein